MRKTPRGWLGCEKDDGLKKYFKNGVADSFRDTIASLYHFKRVDYRVEYDIKVKDFKSDVKVLED